MIKLNINTIRNWLPNKADLPEGLRIGLPMVFGLLLFSYLGDSASGVNALIAAWLVGVQGRNLAYNKRAQLLSISALLCVLSTVVAYISTVNLWLGVAILLAISLLYGLCSNQRKYIQLLAYNCGFCFICAMHLYHSNVATDFVIMSTLFGAVTAVISAVIAGPWLAIRQGQQQLDKVNVQLALWCLQLGSSHANDVAKRLALRQALDDAIAVLAHYLIEMPNKPYVTPIATELFGRLTLIENLEILARLAETTDQHNQQEIKQYIHCLAAKIHAKACVNCSDKAVVPVDLPPLITNAINLLQHSLKPAPLPTDWLAQLTLIWPSDRESIKTQWHKAIRRNSREWHHGLRIVFTLLCCQFVVELLHLPQGYWVTLTAFIVLMTAPLGQLQARIWSRSYGTVLGSLIALGLIWWQGQGSWLIAATCLSAFVAFATYYNARYEVHVFWLTLLMVFAISLLLPSEPYIAFYRVIDTFAGVIIAFLAMHLFIPSWTKRWLDSYISHWWQLEQQRLQSTDKDQQAKLRWRAHTALRQLNQEIASLKLEPNSNIRELADYQSLLEFGLNLHTSLVIYHKYGDSKLDINAAAKDLSQWLEMFSSRYQDAWCPLPVQFRDEANQPYQWLDKDMAQLFAWLAWQQPYRAK